MRQNRTLWIWLISIMAGGLILWGSFQFDRPVHLWQHEHHPKMNMQTISRNVTRATDWPVHIILGLVLAGIAWRRGSTRWTRIFLLMVASLALAGSTAEVIKWSTGRVRPNVKLEKTWGGPTTAQNFHSFPSGHAAASFGFFGLLFFANWRLGLLCLPIPLFVGFTRIFLGAHYFSDVVGAALIGILCAAIVARFLPAANSGHAIGER